jgi:hypothetical protein
MNKGMGFLIMVIKNVYEDVTHLSSSPYSTTVLNVASAQRRKPITKTQMGLQ